MGTEHLTATIQRFWTRIDEADKRLKNFTNDMSGREEQVDILLNKLVEDSGMSLPQGLEKGDVVQEKLMESLQQFNELVKTWADCIQEVKNGQAFIHENEKHMLIMVFGKVKTGKSSLGNFLAGKEFLHAKFNNEYKCRYANVLTRPEFKVEIKGRENNLEDGWFRAAETDCTGAIQHFTVPGFRWVDSAGIGAVTKDGDSFDMELMVRKYLNYADWGVFLMSSDSPGLQPDFEYINRLYENGKPAIVVITKSDINDEQVINDEIVPHWVAKKDSDRLDQENWIRSELGSKDFQDKFQVLSVSTYLAIQAINKQDDDIFRQSQMDVFMDILGERIGDEAVQLKEQNPRGNINRLIRLILLGAEADDKQKGVKGLEFILCKFGDVLDSIEEHKRKLVGMEMAIVQKINSIVKHELEVELNRAGKQVEKGKQNLSGDQISRIISAKLQQAATIELDRGISELINNFSKDRLNFSVNINVATGLEVVEETLEQRIVHYSRVERNPDGIFEKIGSYFGKTYYRSKQYEEIRHVKFDVGTNLQNILDDIFKTVEETTKTIVHNELQRIAIQYFEPQEQYVLTVQEKIRQFQHAITQLKYLSPNE